jgi:hypothetical protein
MAIVDKEDWLVCSLPLFGMGNKYILEPLNGEVITGPAIVR